eukprot:TRINITY_DN1317_c1_g2_i1.p3 TRINITY_DN1317_c1_g2~~TRINITY_DN1317_c1_g2_i1.p3  ORF type:complete len:130 (-),score=6.68 TRINITY_DN1317_c1_g2_i1:138-527(-)
MGCWGASECGWRSSGCGVLPRRLRRAAPVPALPQWWARALAATRLTWFCYHHCRSGAATVPDAYFDHQQHCRGSGGKWEQPARTLCAGAVSLDPFICMTSVLVRNLLAAAASNCNFLNPSFRISLEKVR